MSTQEKPSPNKDPKEKGDNDKNKTNPGKPNNDPDQTPEREVNNPPVAEPEKTNKPGKIGFSDQFLLF